MQIIFVKSSSYFNGELLRKILETSNLIYALEECGTEQKSRALLFSQFEFFLCSTVFYHTHHVKGWVAKCSVLAYIGLQHNAVYST